MTVRDKKMYFYMSISYFNSCSPVTAILRKFSTNTGLRGKTMETHGKIRKRTEEEGDNSERNRHVIA